MLRRFVDGLREPIVLAHHPLCGRFEEHVFVLRGRKVCRGCVTAYPAAITALLAFLTLRPLAYDALFALSLLAFGLNLGRFLFSRSVLTDILFNALLGISLAAVISAALLAPPGERTIIAAIAVFVFIAFNLFKGYRMFATCRSCPSFHKFPHCTVQRPWPEDEATDRYPERDTGTAAP
jgi:hypothetical protein